MKHISRSIVTLDLLKQQNLPTIMHFYFKKNEKIETHAKTNLLNNNCLQFMIHGCFLVHLDCQFALLLIDLRFYNLCFNHSFKQLSNIVLMSKKQPFELFNYDCIGIF